MSATVHITLAVHPRYGQEAQVLRAHGPDAVCLEYCDEQVTIVPKAWTSLVPRAAPLAVGGTPVRLCPEATKKLAEWVRARAKRAGKKSWRNDQSGREQKSGWPTRATVRTR